jgi:hypothetical protein
VIPAYAGAILVTRQPDEEPTSSCTWSRETGEAAQLNIRRDLVQRALWERAQRAAPEDSPLAREIARDLFVLPEHFPFAAVGILFDQVAVIVTHVSLRG